MKKKRSTIIDVAKAAGVSKSTVSLVLQKSPLVNEKTRKHVLAAMQETKYVYNRAAANLRGARFGLIGLVINDLRNPYYTELAVSVQMFFFSRGYATIIANSNEDPILQEQLIASMIEHGVSALMVAPCYGAAPNLFDGVLSAEIPTLQVLRCIDSRVDQLPFYSMDYETGSYIATNHLIDNGKSRVAFVGGIDGREITKERKAGYLMRLAEQGDKPLVFHGAADRDFGYEIAIVIAQNQPEISAAVTFNDLVALGMMAGFASVGITIGKQFRLVGFDDIKEASNSFPKLSSVRCDVNKFGLKTAALLLDWLENENVPESVVRYPVELVKRGSSI